MKTYHHQTFLRSPHRLITHRLTHVHHFTRLSIYPPRSSISSQLRRARLSKPISPGALRGKIRRFLEQYNVTSTSFQKVIGVNPGSYNTFMTGKYKDPWAATMNSTYDGAAYSFHLEKKLGKNSITAKLKLKQQGGSASAARAAGGAAGAAPAAAGGGSAASRPKLPDLSGVVLEDAENVWMTPKEVRAEISTLKRRYKFSNAELAIAAGCGGGSSQPGARVGRFLSATGEFGGETQDFYKPAAIFCEKMRVHENRPKSKKRKDLEADAGTQPGKKPFLGLNPDNSYWCMAGSVMAKDHLGRNVIRW